MKINNVDGVRLDKSVNRLNTVHVAEKLVGTHEILKKENVGTRKIEKSNQSLVLSLLTPYFVTRI